MLIKYLYDKTLTPQQQAIQASSAIQQATEEAKRIAVRRQIEAEERAKYQQKLDQIAEQQRIQKAKETESQIKKDRENSAKNLIETLRREFFEKNFDATENDFLELLPKLKEQHFFARKSASEKLLVKSGIYRKM